MTKGYIHVNTGDGKGKTTAALGLAIRCAGRGEKVLFVQFLKGQETGEEAITNRLPEITHRKLMNARSFFHHLKSEEQDALRVQGGKEWENLMKEIRNTSYRLLVLDEIMAVMYLGILPEEEVLQFLKEKPESLEVVLTGRDAPETIMDVADLVSVIEKKKHYYDQGVLSRKGIEY
ncbi:MAG TPA: cob(I)yrinic acid a,c-diamide adenosyltransferase [Clostridiaceae bacterium]|nr:cob(I)yrinic acid a,c-diamide adenosyltransferase [Clostridiaceae bacterium]